MYNIAIVGATGLVGRELIYLLEDFPVNNIYLFASKDSLGKKILFQKKDISVAILKKDSFKNVDFIFFCAGQEISKKYIPLIQRAICIDLSSAFRLQNALVIPEINPHKLKGQRTISSPNCTTTIMLMPLFKLHRKFKIKKIIASTYQAASGGGKKLLDKLKRDTSMYFNKNILEGFGFNLFLHESTHNEEKYSEEEVKIENEIKKILEDKNIQISATCVRVPIFRAHAISLNVEFEQEINLVEAKQLLNNTPNLMLLEDIKKNKFATPLDASYRKEVFYSRLRKSKTGGIELWAVGDQLLKGAALNAYQIMQYLTKK